MEEERKIIIYKATNKINGMEYVGQTAKTLKGRKIAHKTDAKNGSTNCYFHNAIRKYGMENFEWEEIGECLSDEEADAMEIDRIKVLETKVPSGYNMTDGGEGTRGYKHTPKQKVANSDAQKLVWEVRKENGTNNATDEARANMSKAHTGEKHTPEWCAAQGAGHKGLKQTPECIAKRVKANTGKKRTDEAKAKMGAVHMGNTYRLGCELTDEHKTNISAGMKLAWAIRKENGTDKHTSEHNAKISGANTGKKQTSEHTANMVAGKKRAKAEREQKKAEELALSTPIRPLKCHEDQQPSLFP